MKHKTYLLLKNIAKVLPSGFNRTFRKYWNATDYDLFLAEKEDPFHNEADNWLLTDSEFTIGIIKEFMHYHKYYIKACREMGVSYKLIDISTTNWIDKVINSNCDAFLIWPSSSLMIWKEMFDERLSILVNQLDKIIYPSLKEIWLYENKRRVYYWLEANHIPYPATHIFYSRQKALSFLEDSRFPLVIKTCTGASASGVFLLQNHLEAKQIFNRAFRKGIVARRHNQNDRHWRYVILQEYLDIKHEWRMVRIGNSFFGHPKGARSGFHSGSGIALWDIPSKELLDFTHQVTEIGNFTSMDVDIFETNDGQLLVNELQTVFGASTSIDQLRVNGVPGRYVYDQLSGQWVFEPGDFARNACANARVAYLVNNIL